MATILQFWAVYTVVPRAEGRQGEGTDRLPLAYGPCYFQGTSGPYLSQNQRLAPHQLVDV